MRDSKAMGVIFSNMHDRLLGEMTINRTTGSLPIGGRYRLIDFALSNMVNAGIQDIGVITKNNYRSLMDHLGSGREWDLSRKIGGLVILPPFSNSESGIYRGRVEALNGIMPYLNNSKANYVIISDCDTIANIDYKKILNQHIESESDITAVYKANRMNGSTRDAAAFTLSGDGRIRDIIIDPAESGEYNESMNIYVIKRDMLINLVNEAYSHRKYSFITDVMQQNLNELNIMGYELKGYSAKINSVDSYFKANMDMLKREVRQQLFPRSRPIYTKVRDEVPAKYGLNSHVSSSLVADGCIIQGTVENSIIFRGVKIGRGSVIKNSIIMQGSTVGENVSMNYIITDKNVQIRDKRNLSGAESYPVYLPKGVII